MLLILLILVCGCSDKAEIDSVVPVLTDVFPKDELPSNGYLVLLIHTAEGAVNPDTVEVRLNGIEGDVEGEGAIYTWKPKEQLPLGAAKISIKGEGIEGHPIEVKDISLLEVTVVSPDNTPPVLVSTFPKNGATDVDADRFGFGMSFTYSEIVNWYSAQANFEPNVGLKGRTGQMAEIDSNIWSRDLQTITVRLSESSILLGGTTYTVTLSNVMDFAGNSEGDQSITFKTKEIIP